LGNYYNQAAFTAVVQGIPHFMEDRSLHIGDWYESAAKLISQPMETKIFHLWVYGS
jgi:hypothetical protein